ncbi:MAG: hypothetical protein ABI765_08030 [Gemmatimonadota bacterium]
MSKRSAKPAPSAIEDLPLPESHDVKGGDGKSMVSSIKQAQMDQKKAVAQNLRG